MTRRPTEAQIQRAVIVIAWCARPGVFAFHVPLGGYRTPVEGAIFKSIGTVAGVPDIILIFEGRTYSAQEREPLERQLDFQDIWEERPSRNPGHQTGARSNYDHEEAEFSCS
jgi:hypothetical protein